MSAETLSSFVKKEPCIVCACINKDREVRSETSHESEVLVTAPLKFFLLVGTVHRCDTGVCCDYCVL